MGRACGGALKGLWGSPEGAGRTGGVNQGAPGPYMGEGAGFIVHNIRLMNQVFAAVALQSRPCLEVLLLTLG